MAHHHQHRDLDAAFFNMSLGDDGPRRVDYRRAWAFGRGANAASSAPTRHGRPLPAAPYTNPLAVLAATQAAYDSSRTTAQRSRRVHQMFTRAVPLPDSLATRLQLHRPLGVVSWLLVLAAQGLATVARAAYHQTSDMLGGAVWALVVLLRGGIVASRAVGAAAGRLLRAPLDLMALVLGVWMVACAVRMAAGDAATWAQQVPAQAQAENQPEAVRLARLGLAELLTLVHGVADRVSEGGKHWAKEVIC